MRWGLPVLVLSCAVAATLVGAGWLDRSADDDAAGGRAPSTPRAPETGIVLGPRLRPATGAVPWIAPRARADVPDEVLAEPAKSVPFFEPTEARAYELPYVPEGWGWMVTYRDPRAREAGGPPTTKLFWPESLSTLLEVALKGPLRLEGVAIPRVLWFEDRRRVVVHLTPEEHGAWGAFLADTRWEPTWLGLEQAATELVEMLTNGSLQEQAWAEETCARASRELAEAVERGRLRQASTQAVASLVKGPSTSRDVPVLVEIRCLRHKSLLQGYPLEPRQRVRFENGLPQLSELTFLDDTLTDDLLDALRSRPAEIQLLAHRTLRLNAGQRRVVELGDQRLLTVDFGGLSYRRDYLTFKLALRARTPQGVVFAPHRTCTLYDRGAILWHAGDRLEPEAEVPTDLYVMLTAEAILSDEERAPK